MLFDDERESPMPADMEQATTEIVALRRILRHERQMLAKMVEAKEKFRRELSAVSKRSAEKDKKIEELESGSRDLRFSVNSNWG